MDSAQLALDRLVAKFDPSQARNKDGEWTSGGASGRVKQPAKAGASKSTKQQHEKYKGFVAKLKSFGWKATKILAEGIATDLLARAVIAGIGVVGFVRLAAVLSKSVLPKLSEEQAEKLLSKIPEVLGEKEMDEVIGHLEDAVNKQNAVRKATTQELAKAWLAMRKVVDVRGNIHDEIGRFSGHEGISGAAHEGYEGGGGGRAYPHETADTGTSSSPHHMTGPYSNHIREAKIKLDAAKIKLSRLPKGPGLSEEDLGRYREVNSEIKEAKDKLTRAFELRQQALAREVGGGEDKPPAKTEADLKQEADNWMKEREQQERQQQQQEAVDQRKEQAARREQEAREAQQSFRNRQQQEQQQQSLGIKDATPAEARAALSELARFRAEQAQEKLREGVRRATAATAADPGGWQGVAHSAYNVAGRITRGAISITSALGGMAGSMAAWQKGDYVQIARHLTTMRDDLSELRDEMAALPKDVGTLGTRVSNTREGQVLASKINELTPHVTRVVSAIRRKAPKGWESYNPEKPPQHRRSDWAQYQKRRKSLKRIRIN